MSGIKNSILNKTPMLIKYWVKIVFIILFIVLLYFLVKLCLIIAAKPTIAVDYVFEYGKIVRPPEDVPHKKIIVSKSMISADNDYYDDVEYDPNINAAEDYKNALEVFCPGSENLERRMRQNYFDIKEIDQQRIKDWVDLNSPCLSHIEKAVSKKPEDEKQEPKSKDEDPLKVLKLRLAKGEITKEEFEELKELID